MGPVKLLWILNLFYFGTGKKSNNSSTGNNNSSNSDSTTIADAAAAAAAGGGIVSFHQRVTQEENVTNGDAVDNWNVMCTTTVEDRWLSVTC